MKKGPESWLQKHLTPVTLGLAITSAALVATHIDKTSEKVHHVMKQSDAGKKEKPPVKQETPNTEESLKPKKNFHHFESEQQMLDAWSALKIRHPELAKDELKIFSIKSPGTDGFLEKCTLDDLITCGILKKKEQLRALAIDKLWDEAEKRKFEAWAENNKDGKDAAGEERNQKKWKTIREGVKNAKNQDYDLEDFYQTIVGQIAQMEPIKKEAKLKNIFSDHLTPEVLLAICVQEIAPPNIDVTHPIQNQKARLELYRMMLETGWHPEKIPSVYDSRISYGLVQMTRVTHEGLQGIFGEQTTGTIEPDFAGHTSMEQQLLNGQLLALSSLRAFKKMADEQPKFIKVFEKANDEEKAEFVAVIVAAYHNYGSGIALRTAIQKSIQGKRRTLAQYTNGIIANMASLPAAQTYARNSRLLCRAAHDRFAKTKKDIAQADAGYIKK